MDDFLSYMAEHSHGLYRNTASGILVVRLNDQDRETGQRNRGRGDADGAPVALVTEHRMTFARQHVLRFEGQAEAAIELPAGDYTVTVSAAGFSPHREFVTIADGRSSSVNAVLRPAHEREATLADILKRNMVSAPQGQARSLTLREGDYVVLDDDAREHREALVKVDLASLRHAKAVFGTPDSAFVDQRPRFGPGSVVREMPAANSDQGLDVAKRAALQEWIYGNSASVDHWTPVLDDWIKNERINVGIYVLQDVDVGPHATLVVGAAGLLCNTLSVHYTGRVRIKGPGPTKIEMNHYVRYGFMTVVGTVSGPWSQLVHST